MTLFSLSTRKWSKDEVRPIAPGIYYGYIVETSARMTSSGPATYIAIQISKYRTLFKWSKLQDLREEFVPGDFVVLEVRIDSQAYMYANRVGTVTQLNGLEPLAH